MNIPFSAYDFFGYLANGLVVICAFEYAFFGTSLTERDWKIGPTVFYIVIAYIVGHIVANVSSYFLEHKVVREWLKSPEEILFNEPKKPGEKKTWREFCFPIFHRPFPAETQKRVLEMARKNGFEKPSRGLFLHAHAVVKQDKVTLEPLTSFLNLYGFCRNVSTGLIISAIILLIGALMDVRHWSEIDNYKLAWMGAALVGAVGMFYRYLKFFKHYSTEVFVSYAELKKDKPTEAPENP
jgi:hypothetical protein